MSQDGENVWRVGLSGSHKPYGYCLLEREFQNLDYITVVVVDIKKLIKCFARDSLTIPSADRWKTEKREGIREFLNPKHGPRTMPYVGFEVRKTKRFLSLLGFPGVGIATFNNGRHRARYMQYAGAIEIPVEVNIKDASLLEKYCGLTRRLSAA